MTPRERAPTLFGKVMRREKGVLAWTSKRVRVGGFYGDAGGFYYWSGYGTSTLHRFTNPQSAANDAERWLTKLKRQLETMGA